MKRKNLIPILSVFLIGLAGCERDPRSKLSNPLQDGDVPQTSGRYTIYQDELKTAGGVGLIPGGENQSIAFDDTGTPKISNFILRYSWSGGPVYNAQFGVYQQAFAGFSLLVTPDYSTFDSARPRDLSGPGYTKLTFLLRGSLSHNTTLKIEGPDDGTGGITPQSLELTASQLTGDLQQFTLNIPASHFTTIRSFMTVTFQYRQPPRTTEHGNGGVVYFDNIYYEQ